MEGRKDTTGPSAEHAFERVHERGRFADFVFGECHGAATGVFPLDAEAFGAEAKAVEEQFGHELFAGEKVLFVEVGRPSGLAAGEGVEGVAGNEERACLVERLLDLVVVSRFRECVPRGSVRGEGISRVDSTGVIVLAFLGANVEDFGCVVEHGVDKGSCSVTHLGECSFVLRCKTKRRFVREDDFGHAVQVDLVLDGDVGTVRTSGVAAKTSDIAIIFAVCALGRNACGDAELGVHHERVIFADLPPFGFDGGEFAHSHAPEGVVAGVKIDGDITEDAGQFPVDVAVGADACRKSFVFVDPICKVDFVDFVAFNDHGGKDGVGDVRRLFVFADGEVVDHSERVVVDVVESIEDIVLVAEVGGDKVGGKIVRTVDFGHGDLREHGEYLEGADNAFDFIRLDGGFEQVHGPVGFEFGIVDGGDGIASDERGERCHRRVYVAFGVHEGEGESVSIDGRDFVGGSGRASPDGIFDVTIGVVQVDRLADVGRTEAGFYFV